MKTIPITLSSEVPSPNVASSSASHRSLLQQLTRLGLGFSAMVTASIALAQSEAGPWQKAATQRVVREQEFDEDAFFPKRKAIATYVSGVPEGEARYLDAHGRLIVRELYKGGALLQRTSFYPNGNRFNDGNYVNGLANGVVTNFFPSGKVSSTMEWVAGVQHGRYIQYFENGSKFAECILVGGVAQGERRHYLPNGMLFGLTYWRDGYETARRGLAEPTVEQFQEIQRRSKISPILKDYWRSMPAGRQPPSIEQEKILKRLEERRKAELREPFR